MRQLFSAHTKKPSDTIQDIAVAFAEGDGDLLAALNSYVDMRREMGKPLYPTQFSAALQGLKNQTSDKVRIAKAIWVAVANGWVRIHLDVIPVNYNTEGTKDMTEKDISKGLSDEEF